MGAPLEVDGPTWKSVAFIVLGVAQGLVLMMARGFINDLRALRAEVEALKATASTHITREELERKLENFGEKLERIEDKIDQGSRTRHDIKDDTHAVQLQQSLIIRELQKDRALFMEERKLFMELLTAQKAKV